MKVNGKVINGDRFAFDGCHKIYIIESDENEAEAIKEGYDKILPIELLPETFENSCPFRFIRNWDLNILYVPQCEETVTFN